MFMLKSPSIKIISLCLAYILSAADEQAGMKSIKLQLLGERNQKPVICTCFYIQTNGFNAYCGSTEVWPSLSRYIGSHVPPPFLLSLLIFQYCE